MKLRAVGLALLLLVASIASACLWDYDTLRAEASGNMDIVRVLTGRFERWPDRYYEMRLERVTQELDRGGLSLEGQLERLDNAAVALDRLKRSDEAVAMIERKRVLLEAEDPTKTKQKDHWYRFYANAGTLYAHRWFGKGANREKMGDLERGRNLIAKAIELNPGAHFGREDVQLAIMDWVIEFAPDQSFWKYLGFTVKDRLTAERFRKGLVGLIMLGNAWESLDVYEGILFLSNQHLHEGAIGVLASERIRELKAAGRTTLAKGISEHIQHSSPERIRAEYVELRKDADLWAKEREAFVLKRLGEGKHPDTDKDFWVGYTERPPRPLDKDSLSDYVRRWDPEGGLRFLAVAALAIIAAIVLSIRNRRKRRELA